jgi:hypothetical protein
MLHIYFGDKEEANYNIPMYFDNVFENEWMTRDISKRIIEGVDKSKVISARIIESPFLGDITPRELSGGAKGLILMACDPDKEGIYFYGEQFGDNTLPYMIEIAREKDIYVALNHYFKFPKDMTDNIYT